MDYAKNIILLYISKVKRREGLPSNQKALCVFDAFRAQMGDKFLEFLNIKVVYVPACCTDRLQPMDLSVQKAVKNHLGSFEKWYSEEIMKQLDSDKNAAQCEIVNPVDLSLSRLKPLSAKWLVQMFQHTQTVQKLSEVGLGKMVVVSP